MDLTGIINRNEYYTNHYFSWIFPDSEADHLPVACRSPGD